MVTKGRLTGLFIVFVLFIVIFCPIICINALKIPDISSGKSIFIHNGSKIIDNISNSDLVVIQKILNNKLLFNDNLACGFDEEACIIIDNNLTLCFGRDGCPFIYVKEKNKYLHLSQKQYSELKILLGRYGFYFPCI